MSLQNLNKGELQEVADFFAIEVEAADDEKGPTKKELLAALASGDEPVTDKDYKEVFLKAKETGKDKAPEVKRQEAIEAAAEKAKAKDDEKAADAAESSKSNEEEKAPEGEEKSADAEQEELTLVRYERKNPTYEIHGHRFTKAHPFSSVPVSIAERLIKEDPRGFRLALPSEAADYYN